MKPDDIMDALGGVSDSYLTEAMNYRKPKKTVRYTAAAACLLICILVSAAAIRGQFGYTDGGCYAADGSTDPAQNSPDAGMEPAEEGTGGMTTGAPKAPDDSEYAGGTPLAPDSGEDEAEGYAIVSIMADGEPMAYEPAPLYVATIADDAMDAYVSEEFDREMTGIHIFTAGGEDPSGAPRWYAVMDKGEVNKIYWYSETQTGYGRGYTDGNDIETMLNVLAERTSEENPLYLVRYSEILYAVIGDTAYILPGSALKPESDILPYVDFDGLNIQVICLE